MAAGRSWTGFPYRLASLIVTRWPLAGSPRDRRARQTARTKSSS